jgi:hypothetical protein
VSQQINLFNPIFLRQKKYFSALAMLQALGLILLGSALFYGYALYQLRQLSLQSDETAKRYADEQARLARYAATYSPQQTGRQLEEEVKRTQAQLAVQQQIVDTLERGALGNTSGYSEYLRAFARQVVPGLWLTGFTIHGDGVRMSLSGGVLDPALVPAYMRRLNREPIMAGKSFASLQMSQPHGEGAKLVTARYVEFTLQSAEQGEAAK